jgi:hypothetical protein
MTRDQFLTEKMGECWHPNWISLASGNCKCNKCGLIYQYEFNPTYDNWQGFGKLVTAMESETIPHTKHMIAKLLIRNCPFDNDFPDRFANAVSRYLGWREG